MTTQGLLDLFHRCGAVNTDTRKVQSGDLFIALKGDRFDGNQFAAQALEKGAHAVVVDDPSILPAGDERYVLVENGLKALQALGQARRREFSIPFLGITGSNGKTTTKELIYAVLATEKRAFATKGNFNNHIGVPLTLLSLPDDLEVAIIEMGANQPKDIEELAEIAEPTHGIITNVGRAHLEGMGSLAGVQKTKGELFDFIAEHNGHIFLNQADARVVAAAKDLGQYGSYQTYGLSDSAYSLEIVQMDLTGMELKVKGPNWTAPLNLNSRLSGSYNALNILVAAMIGDHFGISPAGIQAGVAGYVSANNRSQIIQQGKQTIWLDAYNANPSSMRAAIQHICAKSPKNVALILGDMLEMGERETEIHAELGNFVRSLGAGLLIGIGPRMKAAVSAAGSQAHWFEKVESAQETIGELTKNCELILLKGSRGMALERLLEYLG